MIPIITDSLLIGERDEYRTPYCHSAAIEIARLACKTAGERITKQDA